MRMKLLSIKANNLFFFFVLILLFTVSLSNAANRFSVATGNWSSTATWSATLGGASGASVPVAGDVVTMRFFSDWQVLVNVQRNTRLSIKKAVYQITGQDSSGFSIVNERYNNTGTSFSFVRDDVGIFSIPEYDFVNMTLNAVIYKLDRESFWSGEDQKLFTRQPSTFSFVDDAFEFGGFIEIQVFEPLP